MSVDKFDKDIESLYLERKRSVNAPKISFDPVPQKPKRRFIESLSIFVMGGLASFCIFAVINHFAHLKPDVVTASANKPFYIDVVDVDESLLSDEAIHIAPPTPKTYTQKKLADPRRKSFELSASQVLKPSTIEAVELDSAKLVIASVLPDNAQISLKPIYKVLPTYPRTEQYPNGEVKLAYEVNKNGTVGSIEIVESNVNRTLEKAAKKALSQWKFSPGREINKSSQIVFQFNNQ
jgi:TonB family protein